MKENIYISGFADEISPDFTRKLADSTPMIIPIAHPLLTIAVLINRLLFGICSATIENAPE